MKIGFTCGAFDLLHPGHLLMFEYAKQHCDVLRVGLHTDPSIDRPKTKRKPVQTVFERYLQLKACANVDEVIPYETERDLLNYLRTQRVDIRFLGDDYRHKNFTGIELEIPIVFCPRTHDYSSTYLFEKVKQFTEA